MKPVIKKQTHYNLLLMKDDSPARTLRLHGKTLRFLIILFLILIVGGAGGIAGGIYYWQKYRLLSSKHGAMDREVAEMRLQLERLSNLECLIAASNGTMPQTRNEEVGASPARLLNATDSAVNATTRASGNATGAGNATLAASTAQDAMGAANATSQTPLTQANATRAGASEGAAAPDGASLPLESGDSPVRIAAFHARPGGQQRVRLSYELATTNPEEMRTISGSAKYVAVLANGTRLDLPLQDIDGTRFSIVRMKPMQSSARLPQGYSPEDIDHIEVFVDITDGKLYHQTFPFSK